MARGVRRAEIWTVSGGADYAGKPRPAVIVQDDHFDTDSVTLCPFTTDPTDAPLFRLLIEPGPGNGLDVPSRIMVDKVTTVRRSTAPWWSSSVSPAARSLRGNSAVPAARGPHRPRRADPVNRLQAVPTGVIASETARDLNNARRAAL